MSILEKGTAYEELPDVYLIYITEKDFIGQKKGIYIVKRIVLDNMVLNNGIYEFYVNLKGETATSEQRELLDFIVNSRSNYKTDAFPHLARRVTMFKEERKGVDIMCKIIERERAEAKTEGFIAIVRKKYQKGNTPEQAAEALELDTEYVRSIMSMMDLQIMSDEEIAIKMVNEQNQNSYLYS